MEKNYAGPVCRRGTVTPLKHKNMKYYKLFRNSYIITLLVLISSCENTTLDTIDVRTLTFVKFDSTISEADNSVEIFVRIIGDHPTEGTLKVRIDEEKSSAIYGTHFTTVPEAVGGLVEVPVGVNAQAASFRIFPNDDNALAVLFQQFGGAGNGISQEPILSV